MAMLDEIYLKLISATIMQRGSEYAYKMYRPTITGSRNHYVAVYCATHRKQFHVINHSRMIAITATVASGAVRRSVGLRLVGFIHVFQKGDANGHHKVESVAKIIICE